MRAEGNGKESREDSSQSPVTKHQESKEALIATGSFMSFGANGRKDRNVRKKACFLASKGS